MCCTGCSGALLQLCLSRLGADIGPGSRTKLQNPCLDLLAAEANVQVWQHLRRQNGPAGQISREWCACKALQNRTVDEGRLVQCDRQRPVAAKPRSHQCIRFGNIQYIVLLVVVLRVALDVGRIGESRSRLTKLDVRATLAKTDNIV